MDKAPLGPFLATNPFPNGLTEGLFYREKMRAIHRVAPDRLGDGASPPRVLDIGGGRSGLAQRLYPAAQSVTLDLDASLHQPERRRVFVSGDARRLPFPDAAFDAVLLLDVLEHIDDDRAAAREARRVTRPGGAIVVSTPAADWRYPYFAFMQGVCPHERELMDEWGHVRRGYDRAALEDLFAAPATRTASFINGLTAFYHDVAFSRLGRRPRRALYALTAPLAAAGYLLHRPGMRGAESAFAWTA